MILFTPRLSGRPIQIGLNQIKAVRFFANIDQRVPVPARGTGKEKAIIVDFEFKFGKRAFNQAFPAYPHISPRYAATLQNFQFAFVDLLINIATGDNQGPICCLFFTAEQHPLVAIVDHRYADERLFSKKHPKASPPTLVEHHDRIVVQGIAAVKQNVFGHGTFPTQRTDRNTLLNCDTESFRSASTPPVGVPT